MRTAANQFIKLIATLVLSVTLLTGTLFPASIPAEAGILKKYIVGRSLVAAERRWARHALVREGEKRLQRRAARRMADEMLSPRMHPIRHKSLNPRNIVSLEEKIRTRTATRSEIKNLSSHERFAARREQGVRDFWPAEQNRLNQGLPGTRNWSEGQRRSIIDGNKPTFDGQPMQGHHRYNASSYPHLADNPNNIYPATPLEHFRKWHGGDYRPPTHGIPRNPGFPNQF